MHILDGKSINMNNKNVQYGLVILYNNKGQIIINKTFLIKNSIKFYRYILS
jgi:hypothetical protein